MKTIDTLNVPVPAVAISVTTAAFVILLCLFPGRHWSASNQSRNQLSGASDAMAQGAEQGTTGRIRVAQGEYKVLTANGIGPADPAVYGFSESWTLWRVPDGSFEVNGIRNYRSPSYEAHRDEFSVRLSSDFHVLGLTESRRLRYRPDSGPLSCDFLPRKIQCTSNAKDVAQNVTLDLPMDSAFGFMWPISAFSLSSVTRSASHNSRTMTPIELVTLEEVSRADPILATTLSGHLKYLGQEQLLLADHKWRADKFELKVPLHAPFLLWTSPQGLLLAFAYENKAKTLAQDGMVLSEFQQWEEF